jgi:hypothetical protein
MATRQIFSNSRTSSAQAIDLVASLLALEVAAPSPQLYLFSPWITDLPLLQNARISVSALFPEAYGDIWLSAAFSRLAERGCHIHIVCRENQVHTEPFLRKLPANVEIIRHDPVHIKGLFTQNAMLKGSMNFTYSGLTLNDELLELETDSVAVNQGLLNAEVYWKGLPR